MELGVEKINQIWCDAKLRVVEMKRTTILCKEFKERIFSSPKMKLLLEDYKYKKCGLISLCMR